MTTAPPTAPSLLDPATFPSRADAWVAWMALYQTELDAIVASLSPIGRNMLINGLFMHDQRNSGLSVSVADDVYCHDRWYVLTQTANIATVQLGSPENGYRAAIRMTQSQATAQRFGLAQIVEGLNCNHARGGSGTMSGRVRCSVATTIRYAIIGWTGTEDAVTSDWVNSWTNGTFTAGQFFTSTSTSILGIGSIAVGANVWTQLTILTAALGTAFTNLSVMIWTDSAQAQNVTLDIDYVQLETGATATPVERRAVSTELLNCQRYFQSWGGSQANEPIATASIDSATNSNNLPVGYTQMRASPSIGYSGSIFVYSAGIGFGVTSLSGTYGSAKSGGFFTGHSGGGMTAGRIGILMTNLIGDRVTAVAEL